MINAKKAIKSLPQDEQEQVNQYLTSIKEMKKKLVELVMKGKKNLEEGGNMSSGLTLHTEED
jgi:hypothetical protein